jgi:hypothetical protein
LRPNAYLWVVTANQTAATEDLVSRSVVIRLPYEGDPKGRTFASEPLEYATQHRQEVLGELLGMVLRWNRHGRPMGKQRHRCDRWAKIIGGILGVVGLGEHFLGNGEEAEAEMDEGLQVLATLADLIVQKQLAGYSVTKTSDASKAGKPSGEWAKLFAQADLLREQLGPKPPKGKSVAVANFLAARLGRQVAVRTEDFDGTATLEAQYSRSNQRLFFFRLSPRTASPAPEGNDPAAPPTASTVAAPLPEAPGGDDLDWLHG